MLPAAAAAGVGIIARVPLASGLLSGRYTRDTSFAASDHRSYNRHGEAFDVGETFSGVDFGTGVDAAREFAALVPAGVTPAQAALRWVIQQPGVTTVIPGARNPEQARLNAAAAGLPRSLTGNSAPSPASTTGASAPGCMTAGNCRTRLDLNLGSGPSVGCSCGNDCFRRRGRRGPGVPRWALPTRRRRR